MYDGLRSTMELKACSMYNPWKGWNMYRQSLVKFGVGKYFKEMQ